MRAVNLIPAEQRGGQSVGAGRSQGAAYAVLVLLGALALMAYVYGSAKHKISSDHAEVTALDNEAQQAEAAAEKLAPYTSFVTQREARVQAVESLIDSRFDWAHVFHEFGRVLPSGVSVNSLSGNVGTGSTTGSTVPAPATGAGGAVSSATPSGSVPTFTLAGCATSQPTVALTLQRLRLIDGVKEVTLQSSTGSTSGATASSGATGGGTSANCAVAFSVNVEFEPLPSSAAITAATKAVSDRAGTGAGSTGPAAQGSAR